MGQRPLVTEAGYDKAMPGNPNKNASKMFSVHLIRDSVFYEGVECV